MPLMLLPILCIPFSQFLVMDHEQILSIVLLCSLREIEDPVITVSPSIIIILLWAMAC